jgi:hypothetical protein
MSVDAPEARKLLDSLAAESVRPALSLCYQTPVFCLWFAWYIIA